MADDRLFFKLHNGFPEHPKTIELSDKAFRQLVEAWCYCSRNLNDGILTNAQFSKLFSSKSRRELTAVGFIVEHGNSYEMHDYLEHQQSAQQVADLRERRRIAGSRGGKSKANGLASATANAKQTPSKPLADVDVDPDEDTKEQIHTSVPAGTEPENDSPRPDVQAVIEHFESLLIENDVRYKVGKTWLDAARLLIDKDGYTPQQIMFVAEYATRDEFWKPNVLSLPKLREKFEQLKLKAQQRPPQTQAERKLQEGRRIHAKFAAMEARNQEQTIFEIEAS